MDHALASSCRALPISLAPPASLSLFLGLKGRNGRLRPLNSFKVHSTEALTAPLLEDANDKFETNEHDM